MKTPPTRQLFLETAVSFLGYPSVKYANSNEGKSPAGFDCSGFIYYLLKTIGLNVRCNVRHCNELFDSFGVFIHEEYSTPGDLIFFSRDGVRPSHVGIVFSKEKYIHAPGLNNKSLHRKNHEFFNKTFA